MNTPGRPRYRTRRAQMILEGALDALGTRELTAGRPKGLLHYSDSGRPHTRAELLDATRPHPER